MLYTRNKEQGNEERKLDNCTWLENSNIYNRAASSSLHIFLTEI